MDIGSPGSFQGSSPSNNATHQVLKVLANNPDLVRFESLRHHVENILHHGRTQLQIEVTLPALFGGNPLGGTASNWVG